MTLLGSLAFVDNLHVFVVLSFVAQTLGGIGAGLNSTCAMAIITTLFKDDKELYIGILEAGIGIGLLVGPLLGAFLYSIGGYLFPFWTVAGICIALYPLLLHTNRFIQEKEDQFLRENQTAVLSMDHPIQEVTETDEQSGESKEVTFGKLLTVPMFVFGLLA